MNEVTIWDYDKSVVWMRPRVKSWISISEEILPELKKARNELSKTGVHAKVGTSSHHTWAQYCEDIGMTKRYANKLLAGPTVAEGTGNQENYTPPYIIDAVYRVLGEIDLDPASCDLAQKKILAKAYYTETDNGLIRPWYGKVFLNPPYQYPLIEKFINKLIDERPHIDSAILLTNNNTDTGWFRKTALNSDLICLTKGRINFYTETIDETQPTNGQAFFYFGSNTEGFMEVFQEQGLVVKVMK